MYALPANLFQSATLAYLLVSIVVIFISVMIPSLLVTGSKPEGVAKAITCYLWKTVGLLMMSASVVQLSFAVVMNDLPGYPLFGVLVLLFVLGMGIMVHMSCVVSRIDAASSAVPRLIFSHTAEILGGIIALVSLLSIVLNFILTQSVDGWEFSCTVFLLGMVMMLTSSVHISKNNKRSVKKVRKTR